MLHPMPRLALLAWGLTLLMAGWCLHDAVAARSAAQAQVRDAGRTNAWSDATRAHTGLLQELARSQEQLSGTLSRRDASLDRAVMSLSAATEKVLTDTRRLKDAIDHSAQALARLVTRESDARSKALAQALDRAASNAAGLSNLRRLVESRSRTRENCEQLKRSMIYPTVQLRGKGTVGSGVIVFSGEVGAGGAARRATYVLTAYHVVMEVTSPEQRDRIDHVRIMGADDRLEDARYAARVIAHDRCRDIALLELEIDRVIPHVAAFVSPQDVDIIEIFEPAYAVGCPLGNLPLPTAGEISTKHKVVGEQTFWMLNAPTFFGNSGGGIFRAQDGRLIGVSSMVYTYGRSNPVVVPHLGLFVPADTIFRWLDDVGYGFIYAPSRRLPQDADTRLQASATVEAR